VTVGARVARSRYWDWRGLSAPGETGGRDLVRETYERIERAILRAVPSGAKKVAVPLSGGLDSRLLAAVLARHGLPVQAYNIDFGREAAIARRVAQVLKVPLRGLGMLERPEAVPEALTAVGGSYHVNQVWGWEMARRAAEQDGCEVLFDGLAFDTILGAVHNVAGDDARALAANCERNYADLDADAFVRLFGPHHGGAMLAAVRASLESLAGTAIEEAGARASDYFLMTNRIRKYTFGYCLANLHQLPGRFPYVTTELFEHCQRLPLALRKEHTLYRQIYREVFPELAKVPWAKTGLPLDRYASPEPPRWRLLLEAGLRRLSRGRIHLGGRGYFDHLFRRRRDLREVFLATLQAPTPALDELLPAETTARVIAGHLAGRNFGGILQGLYTIKRFLLGLAEVKGGKKGGKG
jgi:hypothetical protein